MKPCYLLFRKQCNKSEQRTPLPTNKPVEKNLRATQKTRSRCPKDLVTQIAPTQATNPKSSHQNHVRSRRRNQTTTTTTLQRMTTKAPPATRAKNVGVPRAAHDLYSRNQKYLFRGGNRHPTANTGQTSPNPPPIATDPTAKKTQTNQT